MKKRFICLSFCLIISFISTAAFGQIVAGFGDSVTQGYPYRESTGNGSEDGGYQPYLDSLLGGSYRVLNYGVGGETTLNGVSRIDKVIQAHPNSTILILEGLNDLGYGLSWSTTRSNLGLMIDKCRSANITPIIGTLSPTSEVKNNIHNADIRRIAAAKGVKLADIWPALAPNWNNLNVDNVHPNKQGYKIIANVWNKAILAEPPLAQPPIISLPKAGNILEVTASLIAKVNPNGDPTTAYYEYGLTAEYGNQTEIVDLGTGYFDEVMVSDIKPLKPKTTYHFRLIAKNSIGETISKNITFQTKAATGPYVETRPPSSVSARDITLNGFITPNGFQSKYYFQYGQTKQYGMETAHFNAGSGKEQISVAATVSGLEPETVYHYRIVAVGNSNTVVGGDADFLTAAPNDSGCFIQSIMD